MANLALTGAVLRFAALAILGGPAALLDGVGPGFVGPRAQPLGVLRRPMIGDLLQRIGDLDRQPVGGARPPFFEHGNDLCRQRDQAQYLLADVHWVTSGPMPADANGVSKRSCDFPFALPRNEESTGYV
jgi:hypothetical protein